MNSSDTWQVVQDHWKDFAETFAYSLKADGLLARFVTNPAVTGAYAEAWLRSLAKSMLPQFRISSGAIIRPADRIRNLRTIPQCDMIIWNPSILPALFEQGDFALVPFASACAVIEVKRTCDKLPAFEAQLKRQQKCLINRSNVLGVVISHNRPLFKGEATPNWLENTTWPTRPAMTRLLSRSSREVDVNGVFTFIYFLSQIAGHKDLLLSDAVQNRFTRKPL